MADHGKFVVPFLDLRVHDKCERDEILESIGRVLDHGRIINGPEVGELEHAFERMTGRRHAVGCGCGTDALYLALRALDIGPGDEVITPALIWLATASAIVAVGAKPIFADVNRDFNVDPADVAARITPRTRAILAVHAMGKICDVEMLQALADRHGLGLIEDASQAFGAARAGRPAGSFGRISCMSLNPMKLLAACGEAGMVTTDDETLAARVERLRHHGMIDKEHSAEPSLNMRLDTVQGAVLLSRLARFDAVIRRRRELAARYAAELSGLVETPRERAGDRDVYFVYTIRTRERDQLEAHLLASGIEARVRDRILVPHQTSFRRSSGGAWPRAEKLAAHMLSLPLHEKMSDDQVDMVITAVREFFQGTQNAADHVVS